MGLPFRMSFWFGVGVSALLYVLILVFCLGDYFRDRPPEFTYTPQMVPGDDFRWTAILESPPQHFFTMRLLSLVLGAIVFTLPPLLILNGLWSWFLEYLLNGRHEGFAFRALKYVLLIFALPIVLYLPMSVFEALGWRAPAIQGAESSWSQRVRYIGGGLLAFAAFVWFMVTARSLPIKVCGGALCLCYACMVMNSTFEVRGYFQPPPPGPLNFSLASLMALVLVLGAWASAVTLILRG